MEQQVRFATLADAVFPIASEVRVPRILIPIRIRASLVRDIALVVGFATLVALCGRIRFYLPENPVPITFQTLGVLLTGATLGSRRGLTSILLFYFVGMAGIPVFQGGNNGWHYVSTSPTAGYLIGFIAASFTVGFLAERGWDRRHVLWVFLIGNLLIYVPGLLWLGTKGYVAWESIFSKGMYPFIPGDLIKLMIAGIVLPSAWALVHRSKR